jgi:primosomal protein N' (replication factor Y)
VGIICADLSLSMPDFRAGERTFQLLAQVAGRAGRGEAPGRVILQTYTPDHFSIAAAREHDFEAFYRQEIEFRKMLRYPPFTRMIQIRVSGRDEQKTAARAKAFGSRCAALIGERPDYAGIDLLGPIEAPVHRVADHYRWQILLKAPGAGQLHQLVRELLFGPEAEAGAGDITIGIDVDPVFLM